MTQFEKPRQEVKAQTSSGIEFKIFADPVKQSALDELLKIKGVAVRLENAEGDEFQGITIEYHHHSHFAAPTSKILVENKGNTWEVLRVLPNIGGAAAHFAEEGGDDNALTKGGWTVEHVRSEAADGNHRRYLELMGVIAGDSEYTKAYLSEQK